MGRRLSEHLAKAAKNVPVGADDGDDPFKVSVQVPTWVKIGATISIVAAIGATAMVLMAKQKMGIAK